MPTTARRVLALLAFLLLGVACAQETSAPPGRLEELLGLVPAPVARERPLYYTDLRAARGFSSVLPLAASGRILGAAPDTFTDVLETGGQPLTLLAGDIDADAVSSAVRARGYRVTSEGDWLTFERDEALPGGAPPLVTAVPAGAVRDGVLVLGSDGDVGAVVAGDPPAPWAPTMVAAVGAAAAIALDGREDAFAQAARRAGTDLEGLLGQQRVGGRLAPYRAAALSWDPRGEFDGMRAPSGVVTLVVAEGTDGNEQAATLAVRAATAPILGEGRRATSEVIEGGAPRFDGERGVVRLPVRWLDFDAEQLRRDLDAGRLLFLAPGGEER